MSQVLRLARFILPYKAKVAAALVALVVASRLRAGAGQGLKLVIDSGFGGGGSQAMLTPPSARWSASRHCSRPPRSRAFT